MTKQDLGSQLGGRPRYTRFIITYLDLQAISGSGAQSVALSDQDNPSLTFTLPPTNGVPGGAKVLGVGVKTTVAFTGGTLAALTMSLGVLGALTRFTAPFNIFQAVGDTILQETSLFSLGQYSPASPLVTFTPTGDVLANCTAGSLFLDLFWLDMSTTFSLPA